jgi:hypothetical protein
VNCVGLLSTVILTSFENRQQTLAGFLDISGAGMWRPEVMLILYNGLIRFVLEYGCIAFERMATTHMLKLGTIHFRCLRIILGLMQSTHVLTLQAIGGVPPLRFRFFNAES